MQQAKKERLQSDSVLTNASNFYSRGKITNALFGEHYREIWSTKISANVFKGLDTLNFHKIGGGKQTTSIEVRDLLDRSFSIRTLEKDQSRVLPTWLYPSALRPLLRDQASALNPYGAPVVAQLSEMLGIYHTNPQLTYVSYNKDYHDSINYYLAGRLAIVEEEPGSKWKNDARFDSPKDIINSTELIQLLDSTSFYEFDTTTYLKCRLFDLLISDWDRHPHQWKWVLIDDSLNHIIKPFPIDRDMAFCQFDDGVINSMVVNLSNKFKSYREGKSIIDAAKKVTEFDKLFLKNLPQSSYEQEAKSIIKIFSENEIGKCFRYYPTEVYNRIGKEHIAIFNSRLFHLQEAAEVFRYQVVTE